jgi:hypothetical protein
MSAEIKCLIAQWMGWIGAGVLVLFALGLLGLVVWDIAMSALRARQGDAGAREDLRINAICAVGTVLFMLAVGGCAVLWIWLNEGCSVPPVTDNASAAHRIVIREGGEPATCDPMPGDVVIDPGGFAELRITGQASIIACEVTP